MSTTADEMGESLGRSSAEKSGLQRALMTEDERLGGERAEAFQKQTYGEAAERFPELTDANALEEISRRFAEENIRDEELRRAFQERTRQFVVEKLRGGQLVVSGRMVEMPPQEAETGADLRGERNREVELTTRRERELDR